MSKSIREKINGSMPIGLTALTMIAVSVLLWGFQEMRADIKEVRADFKAMSHNMVYKCDYVDDQSRVWVVLDRITEKPFK